MTLEDVVSGKNTAKKHKRTSELEALIENRLSLPRKIYHAITAPATLALSYLTTGISGLFFSACITLGGIVKRKKLGKRFSGEKAFRDLKAGGLLSPLVYILYKGVNMVNEPLLKTLALNPVAYHIFNGAYLSYTYIRDNYGLKKIISGAGEYIRDTREYLKKEWVKLTRNTLIFLPVNYLNVNKVPTMAGQIAVGSTIDFAYGVITTKKRQGSASYQEKTSA